MNLQQRIEAFTKLGGFLDQFSGNKNTNPSIHELNQGYYDDFQALTQSLHIHNPWFTIEFVENAIHSISCLLKFENFLKWLEAYPYITNSYIEPLKKVGVVLAGNIPLVGFHDFLCVLISGNTFIGKLSSKDDKLLPYISEVLLGVEKGFENRIAFTTEKLQGFDAVIATGGDNSARYFEHYFGKYPNIIRKNRNGIAVLDGTETETELKALSHDIFAYFGLGCRNVSKLFIPKNYDFGLFFKSIQDYRHLINHNKYANNYDYNKCIHLMNRIPILDNGFVLLRENSGLSSPIGMIHYEYYDNLAQVEGYLKANQPGIQCIVSKIKGIEGAIGFGKAQNPNLWDYADDVDTLAFLTDLKPIN